MNAIKIEINLDAVNTMTHDELENHLSMVGRSVEVLKGHIREVKEKLLNHAAFALQEKWPFKEGQLVKVTYKNHNTERVCVKFGYFLRFGKPSSGCFFRDVAFLVLSNIKHDGTKGERTTDILGNWIINIEPYEIKYSK